MKQLTIKLNNGLAMPQLGFGTYLIEGNVATAQAMSDALAIGYRHIDSN